MANSQYKKTTLAKGYAPAPSIDVSWPAVFRRPPYEDAHRAQDSIFDGRRALASVHGGTSGEWLVDNTGTGAVTQDYPDAVTWREAHRVRVEQAPGQGLWVRVLAARSGPSVYLHASSGEYRNAGNTASVRLELDWTNVAADTATRSVQWGLVGTGDADGLEDTGEGSVWQSLLHRAVYKVPGTDNVALTIAEQAKWSEWPTLDVVISHRGGARLIHTSITEVAGEHVALHTNVTATTANGVDAWPNAVRKALEEEADGGAYEENRHGTHRLLYVAARQTERLGPRIAHWSAYDEADAEPTDTTPDPVQVTSTSLVRISWGHAAANTAWDADAPGWAMPATRRAPENLATRVDGAASSPVRARAYVRYSGAGVNTGTIRWQTSPRSWIELEVDQATVGTTWTWLTVTGWLETDIAADDHYALLQDFASTTGGTLEIREWDLTYGEYTTGA